MKQRRNFEWSKPFESLKLCVAVLVLGTWVFSAASSSQTTKPTARIDFGRDVLPIFRQNCFGCHGPSQQISGLRLDRRSSVFKNGLRRVAPGSSENSFLYHRLIGTGPGLQMPPDGPLTPEQISVIKAWIDQGAEWPDALANEADLPPLNPQAVAMVDALRIGSWRSFRKFVEEDPKLLNARGPEGSTPFMYAALYADAATLEGLLKKGADPNARNDANATALMWASTDLEKTRLLLAHGAEVNARSDYGRTPLMIAAGRPGGAPIVKLLLDHGANPNPTKNPSSESSPLVQAALAGDAESMQSLLDRGADVKEAGAMALIIAVGMNCSKCVDLIAAKNLDPAAYTIALLQTAALGDLRATRLMLDHGADVNAVDPMGRTALMYAATSDQLPLDVVKLFIERGADVNARSRHAQSADTGLTALDLAKMRGETPIVTLLIKSGATTGAGRPTPALKSQRENTIPNAIQHSLPLLQRAAANFTAKSGCVSCHNNSLEAMAVGLARRAGFRVDERIAAQEVKANALYIEQRRDNLRQGSFTPQSGVGAIADTFGPAVLSYILVGLEAEHYKPDLNTDAVVRYLKMRQMPDGRWPFGVGDSRPPLCSDYTGQTALSMRALQLYAPKTDKAGYEKTIQLAAAWLAKAEPKTNEDRTWRLLGLAWAARDKDAIKKAQRELLAAQRSDGGWSDLASMDSNAYATGRALVALQTAGLPVSHPAYQRGARFLLKNQLEDGSWYVKTRAAGFQPYFEGGFPHGVDQWISAAGTSWATMALTLASQAPAANSMPSARTHLR
ncbi:MAG TPA: ankyrin repeat domain-containing protein [Blastocatellia bacterium]|jgi:ankyrin repeat protein